MKRPITAEKENVMQYAIEMAVANDEYLRAARFAEQISDNAARANVINDIARQAIADGDLASAGDLCDRYPDELSPDIGWEIESILADFVVEDERSTVPMPFYARKRG
jgi:hypothetical protein